MPESARQLARDVAYLSREIGPRPPGSLAEAAAAEWIAERWQGLGLDTRLEPAPGPSHTATTAEIVLDSGAGGVPIESLPSLFSCAAAVSGPLCRLRADLTCLEADFLRGRVGVWMPCGSLAQRRRGVLHLQEAGLCALIVGSPQFDTIGTKLVREPALGSMPVVAVSWRSAQRLVDHVGRRIAVTVHADPSLAASSRNVVAVIPGSTDSWLVVSAHHDSAPFSPGATDNGGGVATLLALPEWLRRGGPPAATICLVSTAAEEYGRSDGVGAGAQAFIESRRDQWSSCLGWIEVDSVGVPLGTLSVFAGGPKPFRDAVFHGRMPAEATFAGKAAVGCDHGAAEQRGIPTAWFTDSRDVPRPFYHTPADTDDLFQAEQAAAYLPAIAESVIRVAATVQVNPPVALDGGCIRQARHDDITAAVEITKASFGPVSGACMAEAFFGEPLGGRPWHAYKGGDIARAMRADIYRFVVAEVEGQVVGFASFATDAVRGIASIGNNAVHPDWQGRGIGSAQQREIDRRMRQEGYSRFKVVTLSNDIPAQRMYERLGYERISETINYLRGDGPRG